MEWLGDDEQDWGHAWVEAGGLASGRCRGQMASEGSAGHGMPASNSCFSHPKVQGADLESSRAITRDSVGERRIAITGASAFMLISECVKPYVK